MPVSVNNLWEARTTGLNDYEEGKMSSFSFLCWEKERANGTLMSTHWFVFSSLWSLFFVLLLFFPPLTLVGITQKEHCLLDSSVSLTGVWIFPTITLALMKSIFLQFIFFIPRILQRKALVFTSLPPKKIVVKPLSSLKTRVYKLWSRMYIIYMDYI